MSKLAKYSGGMSGYVAGGPGIQIYSAPGEGSTLGGGGMHSHIIDPIELAIQHGS